METSEVNFKILTGPTESGWCSFEVAIGDESWQCQASYLGGYPLSPLIHSVVNLYNHIYVEEIPAENAIFDSVIYDEPGAILIRVSSADESVIVEIYKDDEPFMESPKPASLRSTASIDFWDYALAIYDDAKRAISNQGFLGIRNGWRGTHDWGVDFEHNIFPIEQFLYLGFLIANRMPPTQSSISSEISLLNEIASNADS